jgi:hypothetical protein
MTKSYAHGTEEKGINGMSYYERKYLKHKDGVYDETDNKNPNNMKWRNYLVISQLPSFTVANEMQGRG